VTLACGNMTDVIAIDRKPNRLHSITAVELDQMKDVGHGTAVAFDANISLNRHATPSLNNGFACS
jgi:hypothetical protein